MADRERELVVQLTQAPGDLELRRVYGDLLTERGDPRGELIALSLRALDSRLPGAPRRRIKHLEHEVRASWPDAFAELMKHSQFEGGFLSEVALFPGTGWEALEDPAIAHELAAIRSLIIDYRIAATDVRPLLRPDRLPLLERLRISAAFVGELTRAVSVLEVTVPYGTGAVVPLAIEPPPTELVLVFVVVNDFVERAAQLIERVLREDLPAATRRVSLQGRVNLVLSRDETGRFSQLTANWREARNELVPALIAALEACPAGALTTLHVGAELTPFERRKILAALRSPNAVLTAEQPIPPR